MEWWRSKRTYRMAVLILVPVLMCYFLYRVRVILLPFILAIIITYLINPLVKVLESRQFPRTVAILIIYLALSVFTGLIIFYAMPELFRELNKFALNIPAYMHSFEAMFDGIQKYYQRFGLPDGIRQVFDERIMQLQRLLVVLVRQTLSGIMNLFSSLLSFIIAPFFAFYLLRDLANIKEGLLGIIPNTYRTEILALLRDVDDVLSKFVRGHLTVCLIIGVFTGLGMALIGVDFAFVIGLIAGITDLIPYFGPFIGAVPAIALAVLKSKTTVLYAILVIIVVQQLEAQIVTPKIMGNSLGLHPLLIIFILLAGGELYGIVGMLLALPVTAVFKVIFNYFYLKLVG